jgi:hypothetical protein
LTIRADACCLQGKLVEYIKKNLQINVISLNEEEIVFDLIGVDASIANALRRILIAEVRHCIAWSRRRKNARD